MLNILELFIKIMIQTVRKMINSIKLCEWTLNTISSYFMHQKLRILNQIQLFFLW